jgi:hypothetical protein
MFCVLCFVRVFLSIPANLCVFSFSLIPVLSSSLMHTHLHASHRFHGRTQHFIFHAMCVQL